MLPENLNISDDEIKTAEKILLPSGKTFDQERLNFIKDMRTLDLQAVPGSGKTTVLLAKLLILDKKLPFADGSGILVLSHTNNAVNEIKNRIAYSCANLFQFPNFVGTIQSFVDEFLAKPYYSIKFNRKIFKIDDGIYENIAGDYYDNMPNNKAKNYMISRNRNEPRKLFQSLRIDADMNLTHGIGGKSFLNSSSNSLSYQQLLAVKDKILSYGIMHFDDAYYLAALYLKNIPQIKEILQQRFKYVFVDEMQDMALHQYNILEKIFFDDGNSNSVYQRIGDKNQTIYNSDVQSESCWVDRDPKLQITGSQRLTINNAEIIKYFGIEFIDIVGKRIIEDGTEIDIKPHIIIYDDNSRKCTVIQEFVSIIKNLQNSRKLPNEFINPVKVIAWRKENNDDNNTALKHYCPCFKHNEVKPKVLYENLESYLHYYDKKKKTMESIRKNILNAFVHILHIEGIKDSENRFYTKKSLLAYLKETNVIDYAQLKLNLFNWSFAVIQNKQESITDNVRIYAKNIIGFIDSKKSCNKSIDFIETPFLLKNIDGISSENSCKDCFLNEKKIEMNTVHSVKGETHTATLYLETFYNRKYESQRLKNQFIKQKIIDSSQDIIKQSAKMVYVGFSRPTHLLCFAIHKCRYDECLTTIDKNIWEINDITNRRNNEQ